VPCNSLIFLAYSILYVQSFFSLFIIGWITQEQVPWNFMLLGAKVPRNFVPRSEGSNPRTFAPGNKSSIIHDCPMFYNEPYDKMIFAILEL